MKTIRILNDFKKRTVVHNDTASLLNNTSHEAMYLFIKQLEVMCAQAPIGVRR